MPDYVRFSQARSLPVPDFPRDRAQYLQSEPFSLRSALERLRSSEATRRDAPRRRGPSGPRLGRGLERSVVPVVDERFESFERLTEDADAGKKPLKDDLRGGGRRVPGPIAIRPARPEQTEENLLSTRDEKERVDVAGAHESMEQPLRRCPVPSRTVHEHALKGEPAHPLGHRCWPQEASEAHAALPKAAPVGDPRQDPTPAAIRVVEGIRKERAPYPSERGRL